MPEALFMVFRLDSKGAKEALLMVFLLDSKGAKVYTFSLFHFRFGSFLPKTHKCKSCRSRQELSNEYVLAKFGVDTAENGPLKVCQKLRIF